MRILACDPATKFGWAHSCGLSGTWDLSVRRDESAGMRLIRLVAKLDEVDSSVGVDLLVYEAARHAAPGMQGALVVQAEIQGQIKAWCERRKLSGTPTEYRGYSPSEIKQFACYAGNASKEAMKLAAKRLWKGVTIVDDNQADALCLLALAVRDYGGK